MAGVAATGGTFDILHLGHRTLLAAALENYDHTIIGLVTDGFARKLGKKPLHPYHARLASLRHLLESEFPGCSYDISPLEEDFGPAVLRDDVDALVVSRETRDKGILLNDVRCSLGLEPVRLVVIPMVSGYDGTRISTTKIRNKNMDSSGNAV